MSRKNVKPPVNKTVRCAIYTRKSTEEGLEQEFNSLDAQREAGEADPGQQDKKPISESKREFHSISLGLRLGK